MQAWRGRARVLDHPAAPMKPTTTRQAIDWLQAEPAFAQVGEQSARLAAVQQALQRSLPTVALTVVAFERGQLVVGAAHAAVAAKLRQSEPSLIAALARNGWKVDTIRFKTQWKPDVPVRPRREKGKPGEAAVADISALARRIEHPGLSEALSRLARRHGG